jgi:O-antigen ligase/Flp pilus assembly protein TadD
MASEWGGLALSYFLVRQLFRDSKSQYSLAAAMLATAFALASYGIYQAFWGLDLLRAKYAADPAGELLKLGLTPGTTEQQLFENRLNSHEPFATFALANSLAGFLVSWLPLGVAWAVSRLLHPLAQPPSRVGAGALWADYLVTVLGWGAVVTTLVCLILTQSRTAYVAFGAELVVLAFYFAWSLRHRIDGPRSLRLSTSAGIAAAVVLCVSIPLLLAVRYGKIDEKLFQPGKSLGYRWQYWQSTWQMIRDRLWSGTGPGNFRGHYLGYKLAESSEEIVDPHNLVLEVWATSGAVAAAGLVAALGITVARLLLRCDLAAREPEVVGRDWGLLGLAGLGGIVLAGALSGSSPQSYAGICLAWISAAAIFRAQMSHRVLAPFVLGGAVAGATVHLMGAGGIGMPGVAQSLWLLLAMGANVLDRDRGPRVCAPRAVAWTVTIVVLASVGAFGVGVLRPVTLGQLQLSLGKAAWYAGRSAQAERHFRKATELDPLGAEPWIGLGRIYSGWWRSERIQSDEEYRHAVHALERAIELAPTSLQAYAVLAELHAARAEKEPAFWHGAIQAQRAWVALYPSNATGHARLGDMLWRAGQHEAARIEMQRALELDELTPHLDKKLRQPERSLIEQRMQAEK